MGRFGGPHQAWPAHFRHWKIGRQIAGQREQISKVIDREMAFY
jgi:hypothetical protein